MAITQKLLVYVLLLSAIVSFSHSMDKNVNICNHEEDQELLFLQSPPPIELLDIQFIRCGDKEWIRKDEKIYLTVSSWASIKVGWDLGILTEKDLNHHARMCLEQYPKLVNEYVALLVDGCESEDLKDYQEDGLFELDCPEKGSYWWELESRKWRFALLYFACNNTFGKGELSAKIEEIYNIFGCPEDMESLYDDSVRCDGQEDILVNRVRLFLAKECEVIGYIIT